MTWASVVQRKCLAWGLFVTFSKSGWLAAFEMTAEGEPEIGEEFLHGDGFFQ